MTLEPVTVETVTSRGEFDSLAGAWGDLLRRIGEGSPFLSHDWFGCCLDAEPSRPLNLLVARSGPRITGIAPLWIRTGTYRFLTARTLAFITAPDTAEADLIVLPEAREQTLRAFIRHFYGSRPGRWDVVSLSQWPDESPNFQGTRRILQAMRGAHFAGTSSVVPYVPIAGDWDSFWKSRSYLFRKSRRGIMNRLKRVGEPEVICCRGEDRADEALQMYLHVSERGWKHGDGLSVASRPEARAFFSSLTRAAARRGWLMVWGLRLGGVLAAVEYDLVSGGRVYALRADFDQRVAQHSPGAYLEFHILKHAFDEGFSEYQAGPGRDEYKRKWTEHERTNRVLTLCRGTPVGRTVWLLEGVLAPAVRGARNSVARGGPPEA